MKNFIKKFLSYRKNGQVEKNNLDKLFALCILFVSIEALLGGAALIIQPQGNIMHLPIYLLKDSPFANYLIPGLFLFLFLGLFPLAVFFGLWHQPRVFKIKAFDVSQFMEYLNFDKRHYWAWAGACYTGFLLIFWINFQIMFMGYFTIMQMFYSFFGAFILFLAIQPRIKKRYKQDCKKLPFDANIKQ